MARARSAVGAEVVAALTGAVASLADLTVASLADLTVASMAGCLGVAKAMAGRSVAVERVWRVRPA